ncbi:MAG TPA: type II toxin-antitoxin system Phd/YefM family antitoxin [Terriglobales bacterium]|nr:type II toxin-antitoxin system Phd/YefM family antitoxin [Terriglobales bacterium]
MKTVTATEFRARCGKLIAEVQDTGTPLTITKRGQPVAKLIRAHPRRVRLFGCLKGVLKVVGDIESPVVPAEDWEALR